MKNLTNLNNEIGTNEKSRALSLGLAAILLATGLAMADRGEGYRRPGEQVAASGHVEVVHQVPGGTVSVGVEIGRPRPVVVQPQPTVVVVEHESHRPREVTIIHEEPRCEAPRHEEREVTVIRTEEHGHGRGHAWGHHKEWREDWRDEGYRHEREEDFRREDRGDAQVYDDGRQFSYQRNDGDRQEHYYRDANQVSYQSNGRDGSYHYYEDAHQVSVQDNRNGQQRNYFARK